MWFFKDKDTRRVSFDGKEYLAADCGKIELPNESLSVMTMLGFVQCVEPVEPVEPVAAQKSFKK